MLFVHDHLHVQGRYDEERYALTQIKGLPRQNAQAKDSEWVRTRAALEKDKPVDVNEILLAASGMSFRMTRQSLECSPCCGDSLCDHPQCSLPRSNTEVIDEENVLVCSGL